MRGQPDQRICQQLKRPTGTACRGARACGRHQQGFLLVAELALRTRTWLLAERRLQIAKYKTSFGSIDGGPTHADAPGNLLVTGPRVSGQQNLRPLEPARRVRATAQNRCQLGALGLAEFDPIAYIHPCFRLSRHRRTTESDGWRELFCKKLHA